VTVFCDWLDVTCHPFSSFTSRLYSWCLRDYPLCFEELSDDGRIIKAVFNVGDTGKIHIEEKNRFHRASASGNALSHIRDREQYISFLAALAVDSHSVTRLDAALDVPVDGPVSLRALEAQYPDDKLALTRKALKVTRMYSTRSDGQLTGTWYAGRRTRSRVTARVYDKAQEAFDKRGEIISPTTRYELTFKKEIGCTLRDAYMPASLFYEYASPHLLDKPDDVPSWDSHGEGWSMDFIDTDTTINRYRRRVEDSPELGALSKLAAQLGPNAVDMAVRIYREKLESELNAISAEGGEGVRQRAPSDSPLSRIG